MELENIGGMTEPQNLRCSGHLGCNVELPYFITNHSSCCRDASSSSRYSPTLALPYVWVAFPPHQSHRPIHNAQNAMLCRRIPSLLSPPVQFVQYPISYILKLDVVIPEQVPISPHLLRSSPCSLLHPQHPPPRPCLPESPLAQ